MRVLLLRLVASAVFFTMATTSASAANIVVNVIDEPGEGFNDPTPRNPVDGNPGTTLGEQRLNVFLAASQFWERRLQSSIDIVVDAQFNPQVCTLTSAVLGSAGPLTGSTLTNAPQAGVIYAAAIANSLANEDLAVGISDIGTTFNSNLDLGSADCLAGRGWDYRIGVNTGSSLELYATVLHELAHGLGFISLHDLSTGALLAGLPDSFNSNLADQRSGVAWPDMNDAQRLASSTSTGNLIWTGERVVSESDLLVNGRTPDGVQMYAPNLLDPGSSVSHWGKELSPNELMEPVATEFPTTLLTTNLMYDIGWVDPTLECNGLSVTVNMADGDQPTQGNDVILGTLGPDIIDAGAGNDTICGQAGADVIIAGNGADYVDGGDGNDDIRGGLGNDVIFGGNGADIIRGGRGDDELFGQAGDDRLLGNVGADTIGGGTGVDSIDGGDDADNIFTGSGATVGTGVFVRGGRDNDTITGGPDADDIRGEAGDDLIIGAAGNDVIVGGNGKDELIGGDGDDEISGLSDSDKLRGGPGNDTLKGGSGDDRLIGGRGQDICLGQSGANDTIAGCET